MKQKFSSSWKGSKQPRKQRLYRYNAPKHVKQSFVRAHLSKELKTKYKRRNLGLRKGDKVKIVRGKFKKQEGKIARIDIKHEKVYIENINITKKDGTKSSFPIHPSNLIITELSIDDKFRQKILERKV